MNKYDVNIDLANESKKKMADIIDSARTKNVLNSFGAFASLYDFAHDGKEYSQPVLVLKTEEPGSKQLLAMQYNRIESVCTDMINHLVNDCIMMGAKPLTVQDAIICGKLDKSIVTRIVNGIAQACKENECVLTGGETSEQPGVIDDGTFILTSSIVGVVDRNDIIDGSTIKEGNIVLGVESSGLHTNGYTLVRRLLQSKPQLEDVLVNGVSFIDAVLIPHRCYYKSLKPLFKKRIINGLAHITGGGIRENLNRILPSGNNAIIDLSAYRIPPVFGVIKQYGEIDDYEMLRTFNLGIGMTIVCDRQYESEIINHFYSCGIDCYRIGEIVSGNGEVMCEGKLLW